ncbi:MAG: hypothetical protein KY395_03940, partial [Actinobacteria bacterium]|nr:hypothetical protein [Actinomycetota bacterium]
MLVSTVAIDVDDVRGAVAHLDGVDIVPLDYAFAPDVRSALASKPDDPDVRSRVPVPTDDERAALAALEQEGLSEETVREVAWSHRFAANDRIVKTLLIAALVPEVEPLRGLDAQRLAALNHGSITSRIAGKETAQLVRRLRDWSGQVGELKVGDDPHNPSVNVQLTGVDV